MSTERRKTSFVRLFVLLAVVVLLGASALIYFILPSSQRGKSSIQIGTGGIASDGSNGLFFVANTGANPVTLSNVSLYPGVSGCSWTIGLVPHDVPFVPSLAFNSSRALEPGALTELLFTPSCRGLVDGRAYILKVTGIDNSNNSVIAWCAGVLPPPGFDTDWGCQLSGSHSP